MTLENGRLIFHFVTCTGIVLLANVNCEQSVELDYASESNSSSYEYEEESTVERLKNGPELEELPELSRDSLQMKLSAGEINALPKIVPLYDKEGKRLKSAEIYADVNSGKIERMYFDGEGKRVTIPILLREEDFRQANLTSLLDWMEWLDDMKATLQDLKEKANSCKPSISQEETKGYESVSVMLKDIQDALKTVDECENKLNEQLRDPGKQWNYPSDKETNAR